MRPVATGVMLAATVVAAFILVPRNSDEPDLRVVHPSYAEGYDNVADAATASDVVVLARGRGVIDTDIDKLSPGIVASRRSFEVLQSIKGDALVGDLIVVKQAGGTADQVKTLVDGDPPMAEFGTYLLFLKRVSGGPYDGDYFTVGGPSGRLKQDAKGALQAEGASILRVQPEETIDSVIAELHN